MAFSFSADAQTPNEEMDALRALLNVPASTNIRLADANRLTNAPQIRLFVATGLDVGVRNNYYRWIEDWNDDHGKKYGYVKVVTSLDDANTVLARYTVKDSGSWRLTDPRSNTRDIPVFAYVINKEGDALEIAWRYAANNASYVETRISGKDLWDDFARMLKARGKRKR
jgi:hypothetical protein